MAEKIDKETTVTLSELAAVIGITSRRIRQLVDEGVISTKGKNAYCLSDAVQAYIKYLSSRMPSEEETKMEHSRRQAELMLKASKAQVAKLSADELRGKMHRSEDVMKITEDMLYAFRSGLIALPGRLAVDVVACKTAAEASEKIKLEVHKLMRELADYHYDNERYAESVRNRMKWEAGMVEDDDE